MKQLLICILTLFSLTIYGQTKISGTIINNKTEEILPFVNIGIKNKNIGTISMENGSFRIVIPLENISDTLTFSSIGFSELNLPIGNILTEKMELFKLIPRTIELKEVVIRGKKTKIKTDGVSSHNPLLVAKTTDGLFESKPVETESPIDMLEAAQLINVGKDESKISNVNIYLKIVKIDTVTFRINFYENNNGLPGERLIEKSILWTAAAKADWFTIDLEEYGIYLKDDFFIALELIPTQRKIQNPIGYGAKLFGKAYYRDHSLGTWKSYDGASLSMYVTYKK